MLGRLAPRRTIRHAMLLALVIVLSWAAVVPAQTGSHGIAIQKLCHRSIQASDIVDCEIRALYLDTFGDTVTIEKVWDVVDSGGDAVRIPTNPSESLEIVAIEGNTTCQVGGLLPCNIGPASGDDPIGAGSGRVVFRRNTYEVEANHADRLHVQGNAVVVDNCDHAKTVDCELFSGTVRFIKAIDFEPGATTSSTTSSTSTTSTPNR